MTKYRQAAGITKQAGCHSLRHTFATHKAERGVSPWRLQEWLGHAHINTTQIYVHIGKQERQAADGGHQPMNHATWSKPPRRLRQAKLDNLVLVPGSQWPYKAKWQELANALPQAQP